MGDVGAALSCGMPRQAGETASPMGGAMPTSWERGIADLEARWFANEARESYVEHHGSCKNEPAVVHREVRWEGD